MIEDYPYDRLLTAMREYPVCAACAHEYRDENDRRYHAQTIACKACGPRLHLDTEGGPGSKVAGMSAGGRGDKEGIVRDEATVDERGLIRAAALLLMRGESVAIKGVGGYHLCCIPSAVATLRKLLGRPDKPFAMMCKDLEQARRLVSTAAEEESILLGPERPIVVLRKHDSAAFTEVSELETLGIMLPYTALHHLLLTDVGQPLVMTSCNRPGEPIATTEEQVRALGVRTLLFHDRKIVNRCDDSVIRVISTPGVRPGGCRRVFLRRSRGFAPLPIPLPQENLGKPEKQLHEGREPIILALGAEMNNAVCVARDGQAFLSQYVGDTSHATTGASLREIVTTLLRLTRAKPDIVACDLHPGYASTALAEALATEHGAQLIRIQHHEAHVASVAAEHGLSRYVGIAMDGLGYGPDGTIWGGEVFLADGMPGSTARQGGQALVRIGHLELQPQLGGDAATLHPRRMLFGILAQFLDDAALSQHGYTPQEIRTFRKMLAERFNTPMTSSAGRILDAAAALLGLCDARTYDGRPAMLLESFAAGAEPYPFAPVFGEENRKQILLTTPLFRFIAERLGKDPALPEKRRLAATVQGYLAEGLLAIAREAAGGMSGDSPSRRSGLPIVFSGGVAANGDITGRMLAAGVLTNTLVPCGDGGICYGQAALALMLRHC